MSYNRGQCQLTVGEAKQTGDFGRNYNERNAKYENRRQTAAIPYWKDGKQVSFRVREEENHKKK